MVPKTGPHSGSQKVRFWYYLLHLSKVRRLRNGPHFGSCLKTSFAQNTKEWGTRGYPKIGAETSRPPQIWVSIWRSGGSLTAPLAHAFFEQETTIWATTTTAIVAAAVDQCWFLLSKLSILGWDLQKKGCCSLLESKGRWSDTPWGKARRIRWFLVLGVLP